MGMASRIPVIFGIVTADDLDDALNKAGGKAFADGGKITITLNGEKKEIILNRIHLE